MKRTSFARYPFSTNGRYRLQIVSFGAQQLLCEKDLLAGTVTAKCGALELMEHNEYDAYFANGGYGSHRHFMLSRHRKQTQLT